MPHGAVLAQAAHPKVSLRMEECSHRFGYSKSYLFGMALGMTALAFISAHLGTNIFICIFLPLFAFILALTQATSVSINREGVTVRFLLRIKRSYHFDTSNNAYYEPSVYRGGKGEVVIRGAIVSVNGNQVTFFPWAVADFERLHRVLTRLFPITAEKKEKQQKHATDTPPLP